MLFNRFVLSHFNNGAVVVHLIFDSPTVQPFNPKQTERMRRDNIHADTSSHEHICFTPSTKFLILAGGHLLSAEYASSQLLQQYH